MAYTADIPQANDDPSQSQPLILGNFQTIATAFNLNHGDFNTGEEGLHKFLQMPEQSSAPSTAVNEGALYTKEVSGATQLFWREENNGTEYQITGGGSFSGGDGQIVFPGGFTMKYGTVTGGTEVFPVPFTTSIFNVQLTSISGSSAFSYVSSTSLTGFTVGSAGVTTFNYIALGI